MNHPDAVRYEAFRQWRTRWGAEAADQEIDNGKWRERNRRYHPPTIRTQQDHAGVMTVERAMAEGLHNRAGEFYRVFCAPLHEQIHAALRAGDAPAWQEAMRQAEEVMRLFPEPFVTNNNQLAHDRRANSNAAWHHQGD